MTNLSRSIIAMKQSIQQHTKNRRIKTEGKLSVFNSVMPRSVKRFSAVAISIA